MADAKEPMTGKRLHDHQLIAETFLRFEPVLLLKWLHAAMSDSDFWKSTFTTVLLMGNSAS
jgi:hypothetical protein